jgi:nitrogen fixation protein
MAEILQYAEDGANIMIDNGWREQPPQAPDRDQLANQK